MKAQATRARSTSHQGANSETIMAASHIGGNRFPGGTGRLSALIVNKVVTKNQVKKKAAVTDWMPA